MHLSSLPLLPLYERGVYDLPYNCAVVVGYAVGVFKSRVPDALPFLSWNIRWVILLSLPSLWEKHRVENTFPGFSPEVDGADGVE